MGVSPAVMLQERTHTPDDLQSTYLLAGLGFACLIGWELSAVFGPSLSLLSFCDLHEAVVLRIMSVLTLAATFGFYALKADWVFEHRNRFLTAGLLLALVTVANTMANLAFGGIPFIVSLAAWALFGFAQGSIMMYWCVFFSLIPTRRTAVSIGLGSALGTLMFVFANASEALWANLAEIALLIVGSAGLVAFLSRRIPADRILPVSAFHRTSVLTVSASFSVACHGAVYGFMAIALCSMGPVAALVGGASGLVGGGVALLWGYLGPKVDIDTGMVQRISLPLLLAGLLLFPLFEGVGRIVCGCLVVMALAHASVIAWYSTSIDNYEFRLHPVDRFALREAPNWVGFLLGSIVAYVLIFTLSIEGWAYHLAMIIFSLVVLVAFSVYGGNESQMRKRLNALLAPAPVEALVSGEDADARAPSAPPRSFRQRCDRACEQYGLTPREEEVFFLLAKGRNAEYIAEQLVVSPATVKSHIYHIYRKLGINSQQHLMNIVDDVAAE